MTLIYPNTVQQKQPSFIHHFCTNIIQPQNIKNHNTLNRKDIKPYIFINIFHQKLGISGKNSWKFQWKNLKIILKTQFLLSYKQIGGNLILSTNCISCQLSSDRQCWHSNLIFKKFMRFSPPRFSLFKNLAYTHIKTTFLYKQKNIS